MVYVVKRKPKKRVVYGNGNGRSTTSFGGGGGRPHPGDVAYGNRSRPPPHDVAAGGGASKQHKQKQTIEGRRSREAKKINQREVDPNKRVDRLLAIAVEHGPERLQNEIAVHERILRDLHEAMRRYREATGQPQTNWPDYTA